MTDSEIHEALIAAVMLAHPMSDGERAALVDELNRHKPGSSDRVGCRPAPWRDCPVITHYAKVYDVDLSVTGGRAHARPA